MKSDSFCMKQYKPVVLLIIILLIGVIIWTIYHEMHKKGGQHLLAMHKNAAMNNGTMGGGTVQGGGNIHQAAAPVKIPMKIGDLMTHGNYGINCMMCHSLIGKDQKPAIPAGAINPATLMPHPYWGECKKCHTITNNKVKAAAYVNSAIGKNFFGAEFITITPALSKQFNLPSSKGVLVNKVNKNSFAEKSGFFEGDIILSVDNQNLQTLSQLSMVLLEKQKGDKVKLKVIRNKARTKNLKFRMVEPLMSIPQLSQKIGVMASGKDINSNVAHSMQNASYLIIYDLHTGNSKAVINPFPGEVNKVSNWIVSQKISKVIVGNINSKNLQNISGANINVYSGVFGTVANSIVALKKGNLVENRVIKKAAINMNTINKVAIPANFPDPSANMCHSLENSAYFIIVELDKNKYEVISNPNKNDLLGTGVQLSHLFVDKEVDAVIADKVGKTTAVEMKKLNIHLYKGVNLTVADAVINFKNNKLKPEF